MSTNNNILTFTKLTENAFPPIKGSIRSAGFDLRSAYNYSVSPYGKILVKTDLSICVPIGTYGRIAPRSSLAIFHHIDIGGGVVDEDYTGNVCIIIFNHGSVPYEIQKGDKIAQLICEKLEYPNVQECVSLDQTTRGTRGFGSTGLN